MQSVASVQLSGLPDERLFQPVLLSFACWTGHRKWRASSIQLFKGKKR
jgi:hypothetical protein